MASLPYTFEKYVATRDAECTARAFQALIGTERGRTLVYWPELPGPKSLFCVPNVGHDAGSDPRATASVAAFVERGAEQSRFPGCAGRRRHPRLPL